MDKVIKKYTAIIVLAPGIIKKENGKLTFKYDNGSFSYIIENDPYEFRFKAVRKLYKDGSTDEFILVGGTVEDEDRKTVKISNKEVLKAMVMKQKLECSEYGIPSKCLYTIQSASDTEGNAIAIAKYLSKKNNSYIRNIGLLTNFYHLPRAIRIFTDVGRLRLIPVCAEGVVYYEEYENIRKFYEEECSKTKIISDKDKDKNSEIKGMGDRERGRYYPQIK